MNRQKNYRAVVAALVVGIGLVAALPAAAQETGEEPWGKWWFGFYGGANYNMFSGEIPALTGAFEKGSGLGMALGGLLEYNPGSLFGFNLLLGYDNRAVTFDDVTATDELGVTGTSTMSASPAYLSIEPNLRLNLGNRFFHLLVGPSFGINVGKSFESTTTIGAGGTAVTSDTSGEMSNVRSFLIGAQLGVGYDIPLAGPEANTQILLTPFAQFRLGFQNFIDPPAASTVEFKENTIRAGIALKFGSRPSKAPDPIDPEFTSDFTVQPPRVIAGSRRLDETFPLRNYIFFDAGSTEIPARYKRISNSQAANFREEQLVKPSVETGGQDPMVTRSQRQMEVYYSALNVFGDRMRRNPSATVRLVGSANGDADAGKKMAENVKSYVVSTFGIDGSRITTEGRAMPAHKSGSGGSQGEDKKLIDAENYRVEIIGMPPDILKPVYITSIQDEPIDNDVVFSVASPDDVATWNIEITERNGSPRTFGPYTNTGVARIKATDLIGAQRDARYSAVISMTMKDGKSITVPAKEFRLVRADEEEEQTGTRFSILFEFDDSKTVQTYEEFLVGTVAPAIPNRSSVIIHGHSDIIGEPDYNSKLSQRRSDEVQKILTRELTKAGKSVTFDTYGFGEDERRAAFNNNMPEQRYYNRTVIIEIVPER